MIDGVRAAVEQTDAAECGVRATRVAQISYGRTVGEATLLRYRRQEIDIAGAAQMLAAYADRFLLRCFVAPVGDAQLE